MNKFGVTNPCVHIAQHFNVPQAFVDAAMENHLVLEGVRTQNNWPNHTHLYYKGRPSIDTQTIYAVHSALAAVCKDILQMAEEERKRKAATQ